MIAARYGLPRIPCHAPIQAQPTSLLTCKLADWTLPEGFEIEPYVAGAKPVPLARSLAISGASRATGPVITYVSSISFDTSQRMNVSPCYRGRRKGSCWWMLLVRPWAGTAVSTPAS